MDNCHGNTVPNDKDKQRCVFKTLLNNVTSKRLASDSDTLSFSAETEVTEVTHVCSCIAALVLAHQRAGCCTGSESNTLTVVLSATAYMSTQMYITLGISEAYFLVNTVYMHFQSWKYTSE